MFDKRLRCAAAGRGRRVAAGAGRLLQPRPLALAVSLGPLATVPALGCPQLGPRAGELPRGQAATRRHGVRPRLQHVLDLKTYSTALS